MFSFFHYNLYDKKNIVLYFLAIFFKKIKNKRKCQFGKLSSNYFPWRSKLFDFGKTPLLSFILKQRNLNDQIALLRFFLARINVFFKVSQVQKTFHIIYTSNLMPRGLYLLWLWKTCWHHIWYINFIEREFWLFDKNVSELKTATSTFYFSNCTHWI